nr:probable pre-mRNA-splicing factor ATP-dependent RNA helicase DEAH4 isoform X2 [Tanacetum cinerariifolium]
MNKKGQNCEEHDLVVSQLSNMVPLMLLRSAGCKPTNKQDEPGEHGPGSATVYTHWLVLYLKSLDLPDIDILKFDLLDAPSRRHFCGFTATESLQDALKQLFLIDAIDANGTVTSIGKIMAELPLEPSLARTLIEANKNDCLPQALTVAAMLSVERDIASWAKQTHIQEEEATSFRTS